MPSRFRFPALVVVLLTVAVSPAFGQAQAGGSPPAVTAADYARAEKFLAAALTPLVVGGSVTAAWLPDDRFTYRNTTADGRRNSCSWTR